MLDKLLLDDDDYRVTLGFAGLGSITVTAKQQGIKVKALPEEKDSLQNSFMQLESEGGRVEPGNARMEKILRDFASAIVSRATKKTPPPLSGGESIMFIGTSAMMLVAYAGGGMNENQSRMLLELVNAYQPEKRGLNPELLAKQYETVVQATPESMTSLIASGSELPLKARREILISCIATYLLNVEPTDDQTRLLANFFTWLDVSLDESESLWELARQQAANFS